MDRPELKVSWRTVQILLISFALIFFTYFLCKDSLFDPSHELIKQLQSGLTLDSGIVKFFNGLSGLTEGSEHILYLFIANTLMSRERFWYYLLASVFGHFMQAFLKVALHEPRPTAVWTDIWPLGCEFHFGSPSGHSLYNCYFLLVLLLDHFVPSDWSR